MLLGERFKRGVALLLWEGLLTAWGLPSSSSSPDNGHVLDRSGLDLSTLAQPAACTAQLQSSAAGSQHQLVNISGAAHVLRAASMGPCSTAESLLSSVAGRAVHQTLAGTAGLSRQLGCSARARGNAGISEEQQTWWLTVEGFSRPTKATRNLSPSSQCGFSSPRVSTSGAGGSGWKTRIKFSFEKSCENWWEGRR